MTKGHNSKICTNARSCKRYSGKHSATLHGYVKKKRKVDDNGKDKTNNSKVV